MSIVELSAGQSSCSKPGAPDDSDEKLGEDEDEDKSPGGFIWSSSLLSHV